jgi:hypothetical protein
MSRAGHPLICCAEGRPLLPYSQAWDYETRSKSSQATPLRCATDSWRRTTSFGYAGNGALVNREAADWLPHGWLASEATGHSWCAASCGGLARSLPTMIARLCRVVTSTQGPSSKVTSGQGPGDAAGLVARSVVLSGRTAQERGRLRGAWRGGWTTQRGSS